MDSRNVLLFLFLLERQHESPGGFIPHCDPRPMHCPLIVGSCWSEHQPRVFHFRHLGPPSPGSESFDQRPEVSFGTCPGLEVLTFPIRCLPHSQTPRMIAFLFQFCLKATGKRVPSNRTLLQILHQDTPHIPEYPSHPRIRKTNKRKGSLLPWQKGGFPYSQPRNTLF